MSETQTTATNEIKEWAIVEVMGHKKLAGFAQTVAFGGTIMLRVDVPDIDAAVDERWGERYEHPAEKGFTQYVGMGSIYCLTPTDEATVRKVASNMRRLPPKRITLEQTEEPKQLAAPEVDQDDPNNYDPYDA